MVLICYLASIAVLIRTKCDLFQCFHWAQAMLDRDGELPSAFPCLLFPNASVGRVRNLSWMQTVICRRKMLPFHPGEPWGALHLFIFFLIFFLNIFFLEKPIEYFCSLNFVKAQECKKKKHYKNGNWMATKPFISVFWWKYYWSASEGEVLELAVLGCPRAAEDHQFMSNSDIHEEIVCGSLLPSQCLVSLLVLSWEYF